MPLPWSQTPEEKNLKYLLGTIKKFPAEERKLYSLSGLCMLPCDNAEAPPCEPSSTLPHATNNTDGDIKKPQESMLFKPKLPLPPPIFRQTYDMWKSIMDINFRFWRVKRRRVIYIQPLDTFPDFLCGFEYSASSAKVGFFDLLQQFMEIFFMGFDIRILPAVDTVRDEWQITTRHHKITKKKQYLVTDINERLKKVIPKDGYCVLGVTWTDLYPSEDMNFVLGEAAARHFAATFCFGHYEPKSYCEGKQPIENIDGFILWRMLKVISHETCHIFNVTHCEFFQCSMNESSSMQQALSQPIFLCPVCLRKIQKVCGFSIRERYATLLVFLKELDSNYPCDYVKTATGWLETCLQYMAHA